MYIVFEGVVGTGKSTQAEKLKTFLQEKYPEREVVLVREPGGTPIAESIRTLVQATDFDEEMHALTDAYLYAAARAQLLHHKIKPILDTGGIVISDRNFCSSLAYQGYAQGLGVERVREINKEAVQGVMPDMILFMDLDVEIGLKRTFDADGDKRERKDKTFFEKVYAGYQELAHFAPTEKIWEFVDAAGDIETITERVIEYF